MKKTRSLRVGRHERKLVLAMVAAIAIVSGLAPQADAARKGRDSEHFYRSPSSVHGKTVLIPTGTHIEGRINSTISSNKSQQGEKFTIEITSPILANNTDVIIPSGSRIAGEVVEAIPASKLPHRKGEPKPYGKLKTQITSLATPDGMTYPMVASMAGEMYSQGRGRLTANEEIGNPAMGYVGSQASFNAVHPGVDARGGGGYGNRGPKVVNKKEYFKDPILGVDGRRQSQRGMAVISSIKKKGHDIYILTGSPLRIRIDAPLKIGMSAAADNINIDIDPAEEAAQTGGRRFQRTGGEPETPPPAAAAAAAAAAPPVQQVEMPDPEGHLPAFLRSNRQKNVKPVKMPFQQTGRPVPPQLLPTQRQWGATGTTPVGGGAVGGGDQTGGDPGAASSMGDGQGGRGRRFSQQPPQANQQELSDGSDDEGGDLGGGPPQGALGGLGGGAPQGPPGGFGGGPQTGFGSGAPQNPFGGSPPAGFGSPGAYGGSAPSQGSVGMPSGMTPQGAGNQGSTATPSNATAPRATPAGQAAGGQTTKTPEKKADPPKSPQPKDQLPPGLDW